MIFGAPFILMPGAASDALSGTFDVVGYARTFATDSSVTILGPDVEAGDLLIVAASTANTHSLSTNPYNLSPLAFQVLGSVRHNLYSMILTVAAAASNITATRAGSGNWRMTWVLLRPRPGATFVSFTNTVGGSFTLPSEAGVPEDSPLIGFWGYTSTNGQVDLSDPAGELVDLPPLPSDAAVVPSVIAGDVGHVLAIWRHPAAGATRQPTLVNDAVNGGTVNGAVSTLVRVALT